jgi:hypothetical protein
MASLMSVVAGVAGPLVAVMATGIVIARVHRRDPSRVQPVMVAAFLVKFLFFGAYVLAMVQLAGVDLVPFIVSFALSFVSLYAVQAVMLMRLSRRGAQRAG